MTKEQIIKLLNRKIKEAIKTSEQYHGYNTVWWCDYYSGVAEGLKEAKSIIGMLDKQNNRL